MTYKIKNKSKFGFLICALLLTGSLSAAPYTQSSPANSTAENPDIIYDVSNQNGGIDSKQLDEFINTADSHQVKFFAAENGEIELSESPIIHSYMPKYLSDLGIYIRTEKFGTPEFIEKVTGYSLASSTLKELPVIPDVMFIPELIPTQFAENAVTTSVNNPSAPAMSAVDKSTVTTETPLAYSTGLLNPQAIAGILALALGLIALFAISLRVLVSKHKAPSFTGKLGASNEMVGKGFIFNFESLALDRTHLYPANDSYLQLMWHVGKHAHDSSDKLEHTYFYITFYLPPQQGFAASMQEKKTQQYRKGTISA